MAQFDVFENPNRAARSTFAYVAVVHNDASSNNRTMIVARIALRAKAAAEDLYQSRSMGKVAQS